MSPYFQNNINLILPYFNTAKQLNLSDNHLGFMV